MPLSDFVLAEQAIEVDKLCETAHVHMAHLCLQKFDLEGAVRSYDEAVALLRMKQVLCAGERYCGWVGGWVSVRACECACACVRVRVRVRACWCWWRSKAGGGGRGADAGRSRIPS